MDHGGLQKKDLYKMLVALGNVWSLGLAENNGVVVYPEGGGTHLPNVQVDALLFGEDRQIQAAAQVGVLTSAACNMG